VTLCCCVSKMAKFVVLMVRCDTVLLVAVFVKLYLNIHPPLHVHSIYEMIFKIFWTGVADYTAVVVARSTVPNGPNREFRVILRSFAATA
jgi:hypothetical protein